MDVHVIYFDESKQKVVRAYIGTSFMGHATHKDTVKSFEEVHGDLDLVHNLTQVSMDGPHVNWKSVKMIEEYRESLDPECTVLLLIGSCGLHVLHGAFGTAQKQTNWQLDKYCKNTYSIFKNSPARREDYLKTNDMRDSHEDKDGAYLFPETFCGHRWLENGKFLERGITLSGVKKYFEFLKEEKEMPKKDTRFDLLQEKLGSKLLRAELEFSLHISKLIEPFLIFFQAERPLAVFLFERLNELMNSLLEKFVKPEVLAKKTSAKGKMGITLVKERSSKGTSLKEENLLSIEKVKIGHGAERIIRKMKIVDALEVKKFRTSCRLFLVTLVEKLKEDHHYVIL